MKFEYYTDNAGKWRWNLKATNGNIMADSGQGYSDKDDCLHGIDVVKETNADTPTSERAAE